MFYKTFLSLCIAKKEKPTPILTKLGISTGSISNWQQNKTVPSADALIKLADYFNVSVDYLLGRDEKKEAQPNRATPLYSAEEKKLIEIYRQCPKETKMVIMNMMNGLAVEVDAVDVDIELTAAKLA